MDFKYDLHVHSVHSRDGLMRVDAILELARRRGLSGVAVSDHNTLDGSIEALEKARDGLLAVPAAEYSTNRGHMLAFFIAQDAARAGLFRKNNVVFDFDELEAFVHGLGGLLFSAHPFRLPQARLEGALERLDGVEAFNARNVFRNARANGLALSLCAREGLPFCAGSDAHAPCELGNAYFIHRAGRPPDLAALKAALLSREGSVFGRFSPFSAQRRSALVKHMRQKNYKSAAKNLLETGFGALYDTAFRLNPKNAQETRGRLYPTDISKEESL